MNRRSLLVGLVAAPALVTSAVKAGIPEETVPRINLAIRGSGTIGVDEIAAEIARGVADGRYYAMAQALRQGF